MSKESPRHADLALKPHRNEGIHLARGAESSYRSSTNRISDRSSNRCGVS
jgi:hypothetical protein